MNTNKMSKCYQAAVVILALFLNTLCAKAEESPKGGIWKSVLNRVRAQEGGKNTIWSELKHLSPEDLLICGDELFTTGEDHDDGNAIIANSLLSYHSEKTSPQATAVAIAQILRTSESAGWLKQCIMWLENNDHFLDIPQGAMRQMGASVCASIRGETRQSMAAREAVLDASREDTFVMCLPADSFEAVRKACQDLLVEKSSIPASDRLRTLAKEYLEYANEGEKHRDEWKQHVEKLRAELKKDREDKEKQEAVKSGLAETPTSGTSQ